MWHAFVQWFSNLILFLYGFTQTIGVPNYGLAIILMTILIKLALFPVNQKQLKSMRRMQEIQPRMKHIQENYKDDPEAMQRKLGELYKQSGVNPLTGCLPLLLQMPIFIAFYQALLTPPPGLSAEDMVFFWIPNVGATDPYYILALLAALTTYLQQRVSTINTDDPTQKSMMYMMPLMMAWIAAKAPAGLPLYWVTFNILGILQQIYVNWSSKQAKLATGTGITLNTRIDEAPMGAEIDSVENEIEDGEEEGTSEKGTEMAAGRDKGGTNNNGRAKHRKKRKKR